MRKMKKKETKKVEKIGVEQEKKETDQYYELFILKVG